MSSIKLGGTLAGGASSPTAFQPPGLALAAPIAQAPVANQVVLNAGFDFVNGTITLLVQNQDANGNPIGGVFRRAGSERFDACAGREPHRGRPRHRDRTARHAHQHRGPRPWRRRGAGFREGEGPVIARAVKGPPVFVGRTLFLEGGGTLTIGGQHDEAPGGLALAARGHDGAGFAQVWTSVAEARAFALELLRRLDEKVPRARLEPEARADGSAFNPHPLDALLPRGSGRSTVGGTGAGARSRRTRKAAARR